VKVAIWKTKAIFEKVLEENFEDEDLSTAIRKDLFDSIVRLVALGKSEGIAPARRELIPLLEDSVEAWDQLIDHHDLDFMSPALVDQGMDPREVSLQIVRSIIELTIEDRETIDFDDQLYLPYVLGLRPPLYDTIFVDEAQDLSAIQRALIRRAVKKSGRVIFVGDSRQAIYGFRGADSKSIQRITQDFSCHSLPLSISYRCPRRTVELAKKFVPEIESFEGADEGKVTHLAQWNQKLFQPQDYILCRYNAPLIKVAYQLLSAKMPVTILGRNIAATLIAIIKKLKAIDLKTLSLRVEEWKDLECQKLLAKSQNANLEGIEDKADAIQAFIEMSGASTIDELISKVSEIFSDKEGLITLATVHKTKGLEADRVFILTLPERNRMNQKEWQMEAENNIQYVAITRAKKELFFIHYKGFRGVHSELQ
jgi:superfamily I DNA/RNA helicase